MSLSFLADSIAAKGYALAPDALDMSRVTTLRSFFDFQFREGSRAGVRCTAGMVAEALAVVGVGGIRPYIEPVLGSGAAVVRGILFDKSPGANWDVSWHQDTTIAVRERREAPGFGPWSVKEGVHHVRPPAAKLERMLTLRFHLDAADESNGSLAVIPGSHRRGILDEGGISECVRAGRAEPAVLPAGGVMVMRPLLLHASRKAASPSHRRVLHLEFSSDEQPGRLEWAMAVPVPLIES